MPLFGKKKKSTLKGATATGGYPRQQTVAYPVQQMANQPPQYGGQPPQMSYPASQPQSGTFTKQPPPVYTPKAQPPPLQVPMQPNMPVQAVFDQGARFDANRPPTIPPPPPGIAPTSAQIAVAQGQSVCVTQQKRDFWGFGSDGGYYI